MYEYEGTTCERSQTHHESWPWNITDDHALMIQPAEGSGDISERASGSIWRAGM